MADSSLYEQFVEIAEQRSFTAAAARLNVAQPWLSARIRRLEQQLGCALFTRTTRKVELTEQGEKLLPKAKAIASALAEFRDTARALASSAPPLRLGAPAFGGQLDITRRLLTTFQLQAAQFRLDLEVGWTHGLTEKLRRGDLDASFVLDLPEDGKFDRLDLQETRLEIEFDKDDPLASAPLTPRSLAGRDIQVFPRKPNPPLFDHLFGEIAAGGARLVQTVAFWSEDAPDDVDPAVLIGSCDILWERPARAGRVRRRVEGVPPVAFSLVRLHRNLPSLNALWAIAEALMIERGRGRVPDRTGGTAGSGR